MRKIVLTAMIVVLFNFVAQAASPGGSGRDSANSLYDQANVSYNPEDSPYNPKNSPYNPDNSPYNWKNSPYNPDNSPYNPANSPYNPVNSPYNPANSPYNPTRSTGAYEEGSGGYTVARPGGGLNIFDAYGNLVGYTTQSGEVYPIADQSGKTVLKPNEIAMNNTTSGKEAKNTTEESSEEKDPYRGIWDTLTGIK